MTDRHFTLCTVFCFAALGLGACDEPTDPDPQYRLGDPVAHVDMTARPRAMGPVADVDMRDRRRDPVKGYADIDDVADPSNPPADPARCAALFDEALDLVARYATCTEDRQCDAFTSAELDLPGACVPLFQCYVGLVEEGNIDRFVIEAQQIDDAYTGAGCDCPVAACSHPDYTLSLCPADLCTVEVADPIDDMRAF